MRSSKKYLYLLPLLAICLVFYYFLAGKDFDHSVLELQRTQSSDKTEQQSGALTNSDATETEVNLAPVSLNLALPNLDSKLTPFEGHTWGFSWGDINENAKPDLYLNHHRRRNTRDRFPTSHLIFDFESLTQYNHIPLLGNDQHSALIFDLDGDGLVEIFETIGGRSGNADPQNPATWNKLHRIDDLGINPEKAAESLGLADKGARGRAVIPLLINDRLSVALMNAPSKDEQKKSALYSFNGDIYEQIELFTDCQRSSQQSDTRSRRQLCNEFFIGNYKDLAWGYLNDDLFPDLVLYNGNNNAETKVLISAGPGEFKEFKLPTNKKARIIRIGDFDNDTRDEIMVASGMSIRAISLTNELEFKEVFRHNYNISNFKRPKIEDFAAVDLNADGRLDIISFWSSRSGSFATTLSKLDKSKVQTKTVDIPDNGCRARNFAIADYNLDGQLDILFGTGKDQPFPVCKGGYSLWTTQVQNNWIQIDLKDQNGFRGLGAKITAKTKKKQISKTQDAGIRGEVQDFDRLYFGLGTETSFSVKVEWPDGKITQFETDEVNRIIEIHHPDIQAEL